MRIGIELGLQKHLGTRYETLIEKYPFDFVIGSMHLVCGEDPYTGKVFEELGDAQVYRRMFCETLECIRKIKCFDVLGHLDYVVRYGKHQAEAYSYEKFSDEIDMILRELISSGKGLELNMAGISMVLDLLIRIRVCFADIKSWEERSSPWDLMLIKQSISDMNLRSRANF